MNITPQERLSDKKKKYSGFVPDDYDDKNEGERFGAPPDKEQVEEGARERESEMGEIGKKEISGVKSDPEKYEQQLEVVEGKENKDIEKQEKKIITVADFLDYYEQLADDPEKVNQENTELIAAQAVKVRLALSAAGLSPAEVYVEKMPDGVLGLYNKRTNEIALSVDLLEEADQQLIKTVTVHEMIHKLDKIYDKGLTQIATEKKTRVSSSIYEVAQTKTRRTFYEMGINKALADYDIDNPKKLFNFYLQKGLEYRFRGQEDKLKRLLPGGFLSKAGAWIRVKIEARKIEDSKVSGFKKAVPELYQALVNSGYDVKANIKIAIREFAQKKIKD